MEIIGIDMTKTILYIINDNVFPTNINDTYICLILKINNLKSPSGYKSISLYIVLLKIATKTIANRIKNFLPNIISGNQSAFVNNGLINDNINIAYKAFHFLKS